MRTTIKETHLRLLPAHARYLRRKLASVGKLVREDDTVAAADVEIERTTKHHRQGEIFRAEINLRTARGSFRAEAYGESATVAIDGMKDEIMRQLAQDKDRSLTLRKKGTRTGRQGLFDVGA